MSMTPKEALDDVNERFLYRTDRDQYLFPEVWRVMRADRYEGDCEDYALRILKNITGSTRAMFWALITRRAKLHHLVHRTRRTGHLVLQWGDKYVDNQTRFWNDGGRPANYDWKYVYPMWLILAKLAVSGPFLWIAKFRK